MLQDNVILIIRLLAVKRRMRYSARCKPDIKTAIGSTDRMLNRSYSQIIFTGPYEHHSNILPWRELGQCVRISQNTSGHVDLVHLVKELKVRANTIFRYNSLLNNRYFIFLHSTTITIKSGQKTLYSIL